MTEAVPTHSLNPLLKRVLLMVSIHEPVTAREVSLDVNVREELARAALLRLKDRELIRSHFNGHAPLCYVTDRGRETVALMGRERISRADQEAILAAPDLASIVTCPTCHGERVYCTTCVGCRMVTTEQAGER